MTGPGDRFKAVIAPLLATLVLSAACVLARPHHPVIPADYNVTYTETLVSWNRTFVWTVQEYTAVSINSSKLLHSRGQRDQICASIAGHYEEPCEIFITPEFRYAYFPESSYCCHCCVSGAPAYCGVVKPDWARDGEFSGTKFFPSPSGEHNATCYEFVVQGMYSNHFWVTEKYAPEGLVTPCAFSEALSEHMPLKQLVYDLDNWSPGPQPASLFDLPSGVDCNVQCPGICAEQPGSR
eukprot:Amastigsp_a343923_25.p1 type:complete len:238 gc:universal Amastigsp_a343923_25:53-766(+)